MLLFCFEENEKPAIGSYVFGKLGDDDGVNHLFLVLSDLRINSSSAASFCSYHHHSLLLTPRFSGDWPHRKLSGVTYPCSEHAHAHSHRKLSLFSLCATVIQRNRDFVYEEREKICELYRDRELVAVTLSLNKLHLRKVCV